MKISAAPRSSKLITKEEQQLLALQTSSSVAGVMMRLNCVMRPTKSAPAETGSAFAEPESAVRLT
ncbi:hypothetical protein [Bradyrhizobium sp. DASA03120]|uniref:hypothetical protein n=1 Tax=Bradyrhizobium sp. SMVTL-02 TaxID=3395917 RepID=UPI003F6EE865